MRLDEVVDEGSKPGTGTLRKALIRSAYYYAVHASHANKRCVSFLGCGFCKNLLNNLNNLNNPSICLSQQIRVRDLPLARSCLFSCLLRRPKGSRGPSWQGSG